MKITIENVAGKVEIRATTFIFRGHRFAVHKDTVPNAGWSKVSDFRSGRLISTGATHRSAKKDALEKLRARWPEYLKITAGLPRLNKMPRRAAR